MSAAKRYVLDANVFIQAHRMFYAFDICPGFWNALIRQHRSGNVRSIDKVKAELVDENDRLAEWVRRTVSSDFFRRTADQHVLARVGEILNWVQNEKQFAQAAKAEFARGADSWLVAFAKVNGVTVVTHEEYAPEAKKKVPIPNVCIEFDVPYCTTFEMLRCVREQFVLKIRRKKR